jgi:hypothetical protein
LTVKSPGLKEKRKERREVFLVSHQTWDDMWAEVAQSYVDADDAFSDVMITVDEGDTPHPDDIRTLQRALDGIELTLRVFRSETGI